MTILNRDNLPNNSRRNERSLSPFADLENMFDRLRREFYSPDQVVGSESFTPKVEVKETDKHIHVSAEIPGMTEKDINVTLEEDNLIIEGEKRSESKKEDKGYYISEFSYGNFYRSLPLRVKVDSEEVEAKYKNGVLKITLNKLEASKQTAKRIEIKQ